MGIVVPRCVLVSATDSRARGSAVIAVRVDSRVSGVGYAAVVATMCALGGR